MDNKYKMTLKENIFLAKKKIIHNIYIGAKLEGSNLTFPETQTILEGVNVPSATIDDIQTVLNLRDAWRFLLAHVEDPVDLNYICKINEFVARNESLEWGVLRYGLVGISGTDYKPPVPVKENVENSLSEILDPSSSSTDQALQYFAYGTRAQLFWDGNKRTSLLIANKIMIQNGAGILLILDNDLQRFNETLLDYYNTGLPETLKQFLYDFCIDGIQRVSEITLEQDDDWEPEL